MPEIIDLVSFTNLQQRLLKSLRLAHPNYFANRLLIGVPHKFELPLEHEEWLVFRHGVGFRFVRQMPAPNLVVDAHVDIDNTDRIDAWRLLQFAESSGSTIELEEIKELIQKELNTGVLIQRGDGSYAIRR
jgi:hypothetical protein